MYIWLIYYIFTPYIYCIYPAWCPMSWLQFSCNHNEDKPKRTYPVPRWPVINSLFYLLIYLSIDLSIYLYDQMDWCLLWCESFVPSKDWWLKLSCNQIAEKCDNHLNLPLFVSQTNGGWQDATTPSSVRSATEGPGSVHSDTSNWSTLHAFKPQAGQGLLTDCTTAEDLRNLFMPLFFFFLCICYVSRLHATCEDEHFYLKSQLFMIASMFSL